MTLTALTPEEVERMIAAGARLIDIRDPDEHARERIAGSINHRLARIEQPPPTSPRTIPTIPPEIAASRISSNVIAAQAAGVGRFHGRRCSSFAIPHQPVAPAKVKPAPTKAARAMNGGATNTASSTLAKINAPAAIWT